MKVLAFISVLIAYTFIGASAEYLIATIDDLGNYVTEDLDIPVTDNFIINMFELRFMLYTRENRTDPYQLVYGNKKSIDESPFDPTRPTKILIHGWQSSYIAGPVQLTKTAFLESEDVNVIVFDWKKYNKPYILSVLNSKAIGKNFATFLTFLVNKGGLNLADTHIIGHSLGAHIGGFLCKNLKKKAPHLTGLDPAGPFFYNSKSEDRMDASDATYVDVIHTSQLVGIQDPIAQADFYPNGGSKQPACQTSPIPGGCDHVYGWEYFEISVGTKDKYPARKCISLDDAHVADTLVNPCLATTAVMGDDAIHKSPSGMYYVDVSQS